MTEEEQKKLTILLITMIIKIEYKYGGLLEQKLP